MSSLSAGRPAVAAAARKPVDPAAVRRRVLRALEFAVPKAPLPAGYAAGMTALAACLVLLPAAYGGLVVFLGWLAGWHAVQAVVSLGQGPFWLFHVPMAMAGAVLVIFLTKPFFVRSKGRSADVVVLTADEQPLLFEAVGRLCAATGARHPSAIEVDCTPNAHARFARATDSLRGDGGSLVLRVGLPLAAGLTARQLLGVIGHELGHFNQRRGMAGSYLIRRLTRFLTKVVFARDRVDVAVDRLRRHRSGAARLAYCLTVAVVEPMRGVLWLLTTGAELLTCGVLRRMEHDADAVTAHVAGAADFVRTAKLLLFLDIAHRRAFADVQSAYAAHRLADDLPRLVVANAKQLREHRADVLKLLDGMSTKWFDTHPCYADRVAHVQQLGAAGLFDVDLPASRLFADFRGLCRRATGRLYADVLPAEGLASAKLVPTDDLAAERATQRAAAQVLRRYFRGHVVPGRPIFPDLAAIRRPVSDVAAAVAQVGAARASVDDAGRAGNALASVIRRYVTAAVVVPATEAQLALCRISSSHKAHGLSVALKRSLAEQQATLAETTAILGAFERTGRGRLTLALRLLGTPAVAAALGDDAAVGRAGVAQLAGVCAALEQALPTANRLAQLLPPLRMLLSAYNPRQPYPPLVKQILARSAEANQLHHRLGAELGTVAYPFAHGKDNATVAGHVVRQVPESRDAGATVAAADAALERYHELTFRSLSVMTQWAELAEGAAGLPSLADVPETPPADGAEASTVTAAAATRQARYWWANGGRAAAGLAMVAGLVWLSVSPPALPVGGSDGSGGSVRFRPAAFAVPTLAFGPMPRRLDLPPLRLPFPSPGPFGRYGGRAIDVNPNWPPRPPGLQVSPFQPPQILRPPTRPPQIDLPGFDPPAFAPHPLPHWPPAAFQSRPIEPGGPGRAVGGRR